MQCHAVVPNAATGSAANSVCGKSWQRQQASHLLRAMQHYATELHMSAYGAAVSTREKRQLHQ